MTTQLFVYNVGFLRDPAKSRVLLHRRAQDKTLNPGLLTGPGGKVELVEGENLDIESSFVRETIGKNGEGETPQINWNGFRLRLVTLGTRFKNGDTHTYLMYWFTALLQGEITDYTNREGGTLEWANDNNLPLAEMTPPARACLPFLLSLPESDTTIYNGLLEGTYENARLKLATV